MNRRENNTDFRRFRRDRSSQFNPPQQRSVNAHFVPVLLVISCLFGVNSAVEALSNPAKIDAPQEYRFDVAYAVGVRADVAELLIPLGPQEQYLLLVSSLGDPHRHYRIQLDVADPASDQSIATTRVVPPLPKPDISATVRHEARFHCEVAASVEPVSLERSDISERSDNSAPAEDSSIGLHTPRRSQSDTPAAVAARSVVHRSRQLPTDSPQFHLHVTEGALDDPRHYVCVTAPVVALGERVRVCLDQQLDISQLAPGLIDDIVRILDDDLIPIVAVECGTVRDVDEDGRFTVLLTPWLGKLQGGTTSLEGFVRSSDFRPGCPRPFSNQTDMLYLNSNLSPGLHLQTLLSHEYLHAVTCSSRFADRNHGDDVADQHDWLNEAISHVAENRYGGGWENIDYRVSRFLTAPGQFPLAVANYHAAGLWRNHGCRGATYLFLRWLVGRYGYGSLRDLIESKNCGRTSIEDVTDDTFDEVFRQWSIDLTRLTLRQPLPDADFADGPLPSLVGDLSGWGLIGPRIHEWNPASGRRRLELRGTTTARLLIPPMSAGTLQRIRVCADLGARLQLTLIRQAAETGTISVTGTIAATTPTATGSQFNPSQHTSRTHGADPARAADAFLPAVVRFARIPSGIRKFGASHHGRLSSADPLDLETIGQPVAMSLATVKITNARTAGATIAESAVAQSNPDVAIIAVHHPPDAELLLIACEFNEGECRESICLDAEQLNEFRLDRSINNGHACSRFRIPLPDFPWRDTRPRRASSASSSAGAPLSPFPLVLKVLSRSPDGRLLTAWAELAPPAMLAARSIGETTTR